MDSDDLELTLADPVAVRRAAEMLSLCMLTENEGDAPTLAENRVIWEEGTVRAIVRAVHGFDVEDVVPPTPTAVVVLRELPDEHLHVQATFTPPFDHHNPEANSSAHLAAANVVLDLLKDDPEADHIIGSPSDDD